MIDMKKKATDILEDYSNSYSRVDLEAPTKSLEQIKAEAIKEFTERFESKLNCIPQHHFTLAQVLFDLDKTKKEMAGD